MNTNLRLLIDEHIADPLADQICRISAFNVECVRDLTTVRGKLDKDVMKYASAENRIVVTLDGGFNKSNYPICTHPGIIRIDSRCKHSSILADAIRKFSQCGHRRRAKHGITHLMEDGCRIEGADDKAFEYHY